ncbi:MAG: hypothetical protein RR588_12020 [Solibacillus sp.]
MKKILITTVGALILTAGGMVAGNIAQTEAETKKVTETNYDQHDNQKNYITTDAVLTSFPEYATLEKKVDLTKYSAHIVKDNLHERIIVLKDANDHDQFKSIFVKKQNRLKIVDYRGGLIFNEIIKEDSKPTIPSNPSISDDTVQTPEYKELSTKVDLTGYSVKVVEDNYNKRITLFNDANGHAKYKTIYIKKTEMVKIIEL